MLIQTFVLNDCQTSSMEPANLSNGMQSFQSDFELTSLNFMQESLVL